jgi:hypothetical protein
LFFVEVGESGPLGLGGGRQAVRSAASNYEKMPWKDLPRQEGVVESEFVRPVLLGESIVPFRVLGARSAVLPAVGNSLLDSSDDELDYYPGLADWWRRAEDVWLENRSSERLTLTQRLDFRHGLVNQLPSSQTRVVYGKAGMHVSAAIVDNQYALIDHNLYWAAVADREEGQFLCAVINSPTITELVRPLMSYGKDERHIDKHIWRLPIPRYDPDNALHVTLARLSAQVAEKIAALPLANANFVSLRRQIRKYLSTNAAAIEIDSLVRALMSQ